MLKLLCLVGAAALFSIPAKADVFVYACKAKGQSFTVKIDTAKNTLLYRGWVYKITEQESCAKYGWHAQGPGEAFDFCTATQGVAGFENGGPDADCQQKQ